jgi:hypothetical protein
MQIFHELDLQHKAPKYGSRDLNKQNWNYFEKNRNQWALETTQFGIWALGKVF